MVYDQARKWTSNDEVVHPDLLFVDGRDGVITDVEFCRVPSVFRQERENIVVHDCMKPLAEWYYPHTYKT